MKFKEKLNQVQPDEYGFFYSIIGSAKSHYIINNVILNLFQDLIQLKIKFNEKLNQVQPDENGYFYSMVIYQQILITSSIMSS